MIPKIHYHNNIHIKCIVAFRSDSKLYTHYYRYHKQEYYSDFKLFNIYYSNIFLDTDCLFNVLHPVDLYHVDLLIIL